MSENAMPARGVVPGFEIVNVSVVPAPNNWSVVSANAFVRVGAFTTFRVAVEVLPVPAVVSVTVTLFTFTPAVVPITLRVIVQFAAMFPPESDTVEVPATATAVPAQPLTRAFGVATTKPAGRLSVNATPVSAVAFGLPILNVNVVVPPTGTVAVPKTLVISGHCWEYWLFLQVILKLDRQAR